ncbi:MAG: S24 family peptidase, partial [Lysinibacillus sp.]
EELLFRLDNDIDYKERIDYKVHEASPGYKIYLEQTEKKTTSTLNFYGAVSAGKLEHVEGIEKAEQIKLPKVFLGKHQDREDIFVMKVNGESMNKVLPIDSLIVCLPVNDVHEIKNNDIVIFSYNNEVAVKRFKTTDENLIISPQSTNDKFYDVVVPKETENDIKIFAKVISYHVCLD